MLTQDYTKLVNFFENYDESTEGSIQSVLSDYKEDIEIFDEAKKRGYPVFADCEHLNNLVDGINSFIKFKSDYNMSIEDYL